MPGSFILMSYVLFDSYFCAADCVAGEEADFAGFVGNNTVAVCVNSEVARKLSAFASTLCQADLTNDDLANGSLLATRHFNTEPLAGAVFGIFGGTACFDV